MENAASLIDTPTSESPGCSVSVASSLTPLKLTSTYEPNEWEDFILEWTEGFDPPYHVVDRLGGHGDKGLDITGYTGEPNTGWQIRL